MIICKTIISKGLAAAARDTGAERGEAPKGPGPLRVVQKKHTIHKKNTYEHVQKQNDSYMHTYVCMYIYTYIYIYIYI